MFNASIIIPAYQPDSALINLVGQLQKLARKTTIIVVNDGSSSECLHIFNQLEAKGVIVLNHPTNRGKGAALQTAFSHWENQFIKSQAGVVTADADGQHLAEDILLLTNALIKDPQALHLGARQFDTDTVPWRSQFGNRLTATLFKFFTKTSLQDTQTGLRGLGPQLISRMKSSAAHGYEFEMEMLLCACMENIPIKQHPIKTIYYADNASSHFHPVLDSVKVYKILLKYIKILLLRQSPTTK